MTRSSRSRCRGGDSHAMFWHLFTALATLLALTANLAAAPGRQAGGADDHPSLPPGDGRELMIRVCSQCHQPEMVADQQFDEAGWKAVVDEMASKGAMATEAEFEQIVKYLAAAFPPPKQAAARPTP
jgi:mono/diheme cytochrome c family protein